MEPTTPRSNTKKYLIIFIVVFLVLDVVLLVGFLGRKNVPTSSQQSNPTTSPKTPAPQETTQGTETVLPLNTTHSNVKSVSAVYTFLSRIKSLTPNTLILKSPPKKDRSIPPLQITSNTKVFHRVGTTTYATSFADLAQDQSVSVNAEYNFKTKMWKVNKITINQNQSQQNQTPANQSEESPTTSPSP